MPGELKRLLSDEVRRSGRSLNDVAVGILASRFAVPFEPSGRPGKTPGRSGAVLLRIREPERPRPFKMWLYPLPAIIAFGLWTKAALSPEKGLKWGAAFVIDATTYALEHAVRV